jgi:hypothetical protein
MLAATIAVRIVKINPYFTKSYKIVLKFSQELSFIVAKTARSKKIKKEGWRHHLQPQKNTAVQENLFLLFCGLLFCSLFSSSFFCSFLLYRH